MIPLPTKFLRMKGLKVMTSSKRLSWIGLALATALTSLHCTKGRNDESSAADLPPSYSAPWSSPVYMQSAAEAYWPHLSSNGKGPALLTWNEPNPAAAGPGPHSLPPDHYRARAYDNGAWSSAFDVSGFPGATAWDNTGRAMLMVYPQGFGWIGMPDAHQDLHFLKRDASTGLWSYQTLATTAPASFAAPGLSGDGTGLILYRHYTQPAGSDGSYPPVGQIRVMTYDGNTWGAPFTLYDTVNAAGQGQFLNGPSLAMNAHGEGIAAWTVNDAVVGSPTLLPRVYATRYLGGHWEAPLLLDAPGRVDQAPAVAMDDQGRSMVVWLGDSATTGPYALHSVTADKASGWGAVGAVSLGASANNDLTFPPLFLAEDGAGGFWCAWNQTALAGPHPVAAAYTGGAWQAYVALSSNNAQGTLLAFSNDPTSFQPLALWQDKSSSSLLTAEWGGSAWSAPATLAGLPSGRSAVLGTLVKIGPSSALGVSAVISSSNNSAAFWFNRYH